MATKENESESIDFQAWLDNNLDNSFGELEEGSIVKGTIVKIDKENVLVDVNFKSEGQIPTSEFLDKEGNITVKVGDVIDVFVVHKNESDGTISLSFEKAKRMQVFDKLEKVQENNEIIKGRILRRIKGGYTVDIGGVEAFLPGSHVDLRPVPDMDALVNQEFEFRVLKINRHRSNVIVSRPVLHEEERDSKRKKLLETLAEGHFVDGMYKNITEYGMFIGIEDGIDGLIHVSDISWTKKIRHPSELYHVGDVVQAKVLTVDQENEKFTLGIKQLVEDPWSHVPATYPVGCTVKGVITNITEFGLFVEVEEGVEGLVHVSELGLGKKIKTPADAFKEGQEIEAKVIHVSAEERRLGLSIKQLRGHDEEKGKEYHTGPQEAGSQNLGDLCRERP